MPHVSYRRLLKVFLEIAREMPVVYPVHPRAKARIAEFGLREELGLRAEPDQPSLPDQPPPGERGDVARASGLLLTEPLGYLDFVRLTSQAAAVFTDSGGLQEETTYLGVSCVTLRENTERPITLAYTNVLAGTEPAAILEAFHSLKSHAPTHAPTHAATREAVAPAVEATSPSSNHREPPASPADSSSPSAYPSTPAQPSSRGASPGSPDATVPSPQRSDVPHLWDGHAAERICAILEFVTPST